MTGGWRGWVAALILTACAPAATGPDVWLLVAIGDDPVAAGVTLELHGAGEMSGQAPCNRFGGTYAGPLPAFRPQVVFMTEMACPRLDEEAAWFAALAAATRAEASDDSLVVTGGGAPLRFRRGR